MPPQVPPVKRLLYPNHIFVSVAFFSFSCLFGLVFKDFSVQNGCQNGAQNGTRNRTSQKGTFFRKKILCPKKGSEMGAQKGGQCGLLFSFVLRYCFLLDFGAFRAHFGPEFVPGKGVGGRVNPPNWKIGRVLNLNHLSPEGAGGDARSVRNF